ncbi:hypothetical protein ACWC09_05040 [Streptomyces sp. NPDC001617]
MSRPVVAGVDGSPESPDRAPCAAASAVRRQVGRSIPRKAEGRIGRTCPEVRLTDAKVEGPAAVARATRPVVLVEAGKRSEDEHLPDGGGNASLLPPYRDVVLGIDVGDACDEVTETVVKGRATTHLVRAAPGAP